MLKKFAGTIPVSIGTGGRKEVVERTIEVLGIKELIDHLVTANDVDNHKPHPETFIKCAELMNVEPKYCQVFEDGDYGIKAAKDAGMIVTDIRLHIEIRQR